mmetsp:Transcript_11517/g.22002  ORF Transcript_11517/g.22002 Transcript_11517/m.22002 type:complete len:352 (+) Transcript_11517:81-1136(+)
MAQCCAPCKNPVVFRASSKSQKSEWFFSKSACVRTQIVPRARSKLLRASLRHVSEVVKTRNAQMSSLSTKVEDGPLDMETRSSGFEQPWNAFIDMMSCFATSEGRVARSMRELGLVRKEKIGYGIVGEIYRASMAVPENGRIIDVAVKSLTREAEKSRSNRKRFKMEMDIWAPLKHPNIVSVLKTTSHPGRILVTEMCEEGRLLKYLQAGSSWIRETCEVGEGLGNASCDAELNIKNTALDIAHALEYLHSQGILHGDVKSANVLLDRSVGSHELVAKLCDFGAAEWVGEAGKRRRSVPAVCTPVWAAPEVLDPTILDTPLVRGSKGDARPSSNSELALSNPANAHARRGA